MTVCLFSGQGVVDERIFAKPTSHHKEVLGYLEDALRTSISVDNYLDHSINSPLTVAHGIANFMSVAADVDCKPSIVAGYSVGHFAALFAAGVLDWQDCLNLVISRASLMRRHMHGSDYTMLALIGPDSESLHKALHQVDNNEKFQAAITNFNSPLNHTLAGQREVLERVLESLPPETIVKSVWLDNLGAWHSAALQPAMEDYVRLIDGVKFRNATCKVLSNVSADFVSSDEIKGDLARHLVNPVRWHDMVTTLRNLGCGVMHEFGISGQLSKMVFFTYRDLQCKSFQQLRSCVE